jgi:flagella basal body P-ring formation protein FlgA
MRIARNARRQDGFAPARRAALCGRRAFVTLGFVFLAGISMLTGHAAASALDDNLQSALRNAYALPGAELTLAVQLDAAVPPELEPFADGARLAGLQLDKGSGRFSVVALLPSGAPVAQVPLSGQVTAMAEVPVLRDMVTRGQLVGQELIDYALVPANRLAGGIVVDVADLLGHAARRTLHPGRPIRSADLMPPIVVVKNKLVSMVYEVGALRLTARGRTLTEGGAGAVIKVLNIDSNRTVDALVVDDSTVAVVRSQQP